jgi:hypothetical protein
VAEQRAANIHLHDGVDEAGFVAMRRQRDATLAMPTLLLPSVQVNMRAGLPPAEDNGTRYLKIPSTGSDPWRPPPPRSSTWSPAGSPSPWACAACRWPGGGPPR